MPRLQAVIVLFILGCLPSLAAALSLGDIDLQSGLNQPFVAEIPVSVDAAGTFDDLSVGLAPVATFQQYGLDRPAFLANFDFDVVANGTSGVIRVTSAEPVMEPFVTLLLEVRWPQGRLLREYTVLLDPPVFAAETAAPVVSQARSGSAAPAPTRVVRPAVPAEPPAATSAPPASAPRSSAAPSPAPSAAESTYGPVQRSDTLWNIAGRYAGAAGLSRNQMMLAIYRANPEAFAGNINRLKAGMILRVPPADQLAALSQREATAEVRRQNETWRSAAAATAEAGTLRLVPPPESDAEAAAAGSGREAVAAAGAEGSSGELRDRVQQLEDEVAEQDRLLALKDEQLRALQEQLGADQAVIPGVDEAGADVSAGAAATGEEIVDETIVAEEPAGGEEPAVVEEVEETVVETPASVAEPNIVTTKPDEPSLLGGLFSNIWLYVALGGVLLLALFLVRRRSAEPEVPSWSRLDEETGIGEEAGESTQQLRAPTAENTAILVEEGAPGATDQDQPQYAPEPGDLGAEFADSETPLERTISTDSPVNLDEADPIAEADFHMAYGLYDQAADLLTNALGTEPERKDLRLKLLEVYFIWENQGGFLREAQELQSRIDEASDPDWNKVLIMGKQICPDEDLFAAAPSGAGAGAEMDFAVTDDAGSGAGGGLDIDFSEPEADDAAFGAESDGLDFELSADDLGVTEDGDEDVLDFDLSEADEATALTTDFDPGEGPTMESPIVDPSAEDPTAESPTIESAALDPTAESPIVPPSSSDEPTMETPTIESEALEPTMESPTIESPIGEPGGPSDGADQTAEIELDDLGLDLSDLEDATGDDEADSSAVTLMAETLQIDGDMLDDDTRRGKAPAIEPDDELAGLDDIEATGEMPELGDTAEQPGAGGGDTAEQPGPGGGDTAEQPGPGGGDTAEQPGLSMDTDGPDTLVAPGEQSDEIDFDIGDAYTDSDDTTSVVPATVTDGATMTEVGTKLDLARAYIDMGDPDGARSILNEVLEEATDTQRQEAQKLLDDLDT